MAESKSAVLMRGLWVFFFFSIAKVIMGRYGSRGNEKRRRLINAAVTKEVVRASGNESCIENEMKESFAKLHLQHFITS